MQLRPLHCESFIHGYGRWCNEAQIALAIWDSPNVDMAGTKVKIPFYVTPGDCFPLVGNEILHKSYLLGPQNMLLITPGADDQSSKKLSLEIYSDSTDKLSNMDSESVRTCLLVVSAKVSSFKAYSELQRSFVSSDDAISNKRFNDWKFASLFASKLHRYSHLSYNDMFDSCRRAGVLTAVLKQSFKQ